VSLSKEKFAALKIMVLLFWPRTLARKLIKHKRMGKNELIFTKETFGSCDFLVKCMAIRVGELGLGFNSNLRIVPANDLVVIYDHLVFVKLSH